MKTKEDLSDSIKRLYRSTEDKKIFGICGGLAEYLNFDSTVIRILWLLFIIFGGGLFLLLYIVLYFVIPTKEMNRKAPTLDLASIKDRRIQRSINDRVIAGVCGGIAHYLRIDPAIVRIITVVVDVLTGFIPIILVYLLLIWVIPLDTSELIDHSGND